MTREGPWRPTFELDRFQTEALAALEEGRSVLVAAPTGSGKTVVAEAAIHRALTTGSRAFYTTPIKALSNQKFLDFGRSLGRDRVGLLTGDNSIRGDAPVVVMTTEVLRNMIYARSGALHELGVVVLDEVHYLQDAARGPVWEEVIIHLPPDVQLVCLSATVSNTTELGDWLSTVRGATTTVVETERPVELESWYLVGDRSGPDHFVPLTVDGSPNPDGHLFDSDPRLERRRSGKVRPRYRSPRRVETVELLAEEDLLPAIYFIFSRNACDDALAACRDAGIRLTDRWERREIREVVDQHVERMTDRDLDVLGYDLWLAALEQGIATHHAGMVPPFREAVEACFTRSLVKVVFATETLALGINMPARSVVIEKLSKYNGERHEMLRPGEYTQLTGRAGRRGIDDHGVAVVAWSPFVPFDQVVTLATSRDFPLRSSFRPTYNMVVNLVRRYERTAAMEVLALSFAQFQADQALVGQTRRLNEDRSARSRLEQLASCERGDVATYLDLLGSPNRSTRRADAHRVSESLVLLRPGDVVPVAGAESEADHAVDLGVVVAVAQRGKGAVRVDVVDRHAVVHRLDGRDLLAPVRASNRIELPTPYLPKDPAYLGAVAALLAELPPLRARGASAQEQRRFAAIEAHPVHGCPDREVHVDALRELRRLDRDIERRSAQLAKASGSLAHRVEAVIDLLGALGVLEGWGLTATGDRLALVNHECDLLVALAVERGVLDHLDPVGLTAVLSCVTYEERRQDVASRPPPRGPVGKAIGDLEGIMAEIRREERRRGLPQSRELDAGFVRPVITWARGGTFDNALDEDLSGGDFVRNIKLLLDLLRQVEHIAATDTLRRSAVEASDLLLRDIVAVSSEVGDIDAELDTQSRPGVGGEGGGRMRDELR